MSSRIQSGVLTGLVIPALALALFLAPVVAQEEEPAEAEPAASQQAPAAPAEPEARVTPREPAAPAATPTRSSTRPPRNLKLVGDHWTPYDPPSPESFPEGANIHIIVPGDTLWDLAGKYLENPFLWPQIWDVNRYVTDSHWIYPGDPLVIPGKPIVIGEKGPETPADTIEPSTPAEPLMPPAAPSASGMPDQQPLEPVGPVLTPIADESDVYCSNYIVDDFDKPKLVIEDKEDASRTILATGDIVFLNQGLDGNLTPGDEFSVLVNEGDVPHPIFSETVGESIRMVGRVRVLALQESSATAEIIMACDAIEVGMPLVPFEEIPVPLTTPTSFRRLAQFETDNAGYIVDVSPDKAAIGSGDIINIDLGADNGLRPGDVLNVFREWGGPVQFDSAQSYIDDQQIRAERRRSKRSAGEHPQFILGQLVVLRTQPHTATAKVIVSAREMSLGDRVTGR